MFIEYPESKINHPEIHFRIWTIKAMSTAFKLNARCPPPACRRSRLPANRPPAKVLDALVVQARVPRLAFLCSGLPGVPQRFPVRAAGCPPYVPRRRHAEPDARAPLLPC
ncbi:hypothetical protein B0H14DRAFT_3531075 [Mycena olivaceomarginata]|nr:hypothetical protein B0H14DRAFT_3531075 [Mycena olivaceomarginata]